MDAGHAVLRRRAIQSPLMRSRPARINCSAVLATVCYAFYRVYPQTGERNDDRTQCGGKRKANKTASSGCGERGIKIDGRPPLRGLAI